MKYQWFMFKRRIKKMLPQPQVEKVKLFLEIDELGERVLIIQT